MNDTLQRKKIFDFNSGPNPNQFKSFNGQQLTLPVQQSQLNQSNQFQHILVTNNSPNQSVFQTIHIQEEMRVTTKQDPSRDQSMIKASPPKKHQPIFQTLQPPAKQPQQTSQSQILQQSQIQQSQIQQQSHVQQETYNQLLPQLQSISPGNLENLLTLFKSTNQINQSALQTSKYSSPHGVQYYDVLEQEAEHLREKVKQEAKIVHFILDKYHKTKTQREDTLIELKHLQKQLVIEEECTKYKRFGKEIKYEFQQFESKTNEFKDLFSEAYDLMTVFSMSTHSQINTSFLADQDLSEHDFPSITKKLYSDLELFAKQLESLISEQKRLLSMNQAPEFKTICQQLIQTIQDYPKFEQNKQQQLITVQKAASQYFKLFSTQIQKELQTYLELTLELRNSFSVIDKMKYLLSQLEDNGASSGFYLLMDALHNQRTISISQPSDIQKISYQIKMLQQEPFKHFFRMRNKMFTKCCITITNFNKTARDTYEIQQKLNDDLQYLLAFKQDNYTQLIVQLVNSLKLNLTKSSWMKLSQINKELQQRTVRLSQIKGQLIRYKTNIQSFDMFRQQFADAIDIEQQSIQRLQPHIEYYMQIQDIDAQIDYQQLEQDYQSQSLILQNYLSTYLGSLNRILFDTDNLQSYKMEFEQKLLIMKQMSAKLNTLIHKKIIGNYQQLKINIDEYMQLRDGVLKLMDSMAYLNHQNLQFIYEDYDEQSNKIFTWAEQFQEVLKQSVNDLNGIQSSYLKDLKKQQYEGFVWIEELISGLIVYQRALSHLVNAHLEIKPIDISMEAQFEQRIISVPISEYEKFINDNKFSVLYDILHRCPRQQDWMLIQKQLNRVFQMTFNNYQQKLLPFVSILGGSTSLSQGMFNVVKSNLVVNWVRQERYSNDIERIVMIYQVNDKLKRVATDGDIALKTNVDIITEKFSQILSEIQAKKYLSPELIYMLSQIEGPHYSTYEGLIDQYLINAQPQQYYDDLIAGQSIFDSQNIQRRTLVQDAAIRKENLKFYIAS